MATKTNKKPQKKELPQIAGPGIPAGPPLLDLPNAAVTKQSRSAKQPSYITRDQINSALPSEKVNSARIEDGLSISREIGVNVIEVLPKAETKEPIERAGDPVRMYLREMRSMELLSREGEIAIAKRIEAGREAIIAGLCESPLTFQAIIIWRDELNEGKVFLRDIIDLEATYAGPDAKAMPISVVGRDGRPIPSLPVTELPPLAQTLAPSAMPACATPFKPAPMPA